MIRKFVCRDTVCDALAIIFGALIIFPSIYMLFSRKPVVEYYDVHIIPPEVATGDIASVAWRARELRPNCGGRVYRRFVDSTGRLVEFAPIPTFIHDHAPGTLVDFLNSFEIPRGLAPGEAYYEPVVERWCNPLQKLFWPMVDKPIKAGFIVIDNIIRGPKGETGDKGDKGDKGDNAK